MHFFARRFGHCLKLCFRGMRPWVWILIIAVWAIPYRTSNSDMSIGVRILIGAVCGVVFNLLWLLIGSLVVALKDFHLYKILDEKGFCEEYLKAFEQAKIVNKPFLLQNALLYAEIFERIGQPQTALNYLNTIALSPGSPLKDRIAYFFIYVMCALELGNVALAEEMWRRFEGDLNSARKSPQYNAYSNMVILSLLYIDCAAGRVERAFEQTVAFINSRDYERALSPMIDIDIMLLYELVKLGKTEEAAKWHTELSQRIQKEKLQFRALKPKLVEDLNKAARGELPL